MTPPVEKKGSCFLTYLSILIFLGLILNITGCCLDLSTWVTSPTDKEQQTQETTADDASGSEKASQTASEETTAAKTGEAETQDDLSIKIRANFEKLVNEGSDIPVLFSLLDSNIRNVDTGTLTYMVGEMIRISEENKVYFIDKFTEDKIQEKIYSTVGESYEVDMQILAASTDPELKPLIDATIARKYKILAVEGFFTPVADYAAYGIYAGFIDAELNEFISIYLDESTRPSFAGAGIAISIQDFLIRVDKAFKYLEQYPDSPRYKKVSQFNGGRLTAYLGGIDNSPVFDTDGNIYPDRLKEFENFSSQYQDTQLGDVLKSYLELLNQEGFKKTASIDDFLQKLYG